MTTVLIRLACCLPDAQLLKLARGIVVYLEGRAKDPEVAVTAQSENIAFAEAVLDPEGRLEGRRESL